MAIVEVGCLQLEADRRLPLVKLGPLVAEVVNPFYAVLAGKRFIGIEREPIYFEYACMRTKAAWEKS